MIQLLCRKHPYTWSKHGYMYYVHARLCCSWGVYTDTGHAAQTLWCQSCFVPLTEVCTGQLALSDSTRSAQWIQKWEFLFQMCSWQDHSVVFWLTKHSALVVHEQSQTIISLPPPPTIPHMATTKSDYQLGVTGGHWQTHWHWMHTAPVHVSVSLSVQWCVHACVCWCTSYWGEPERATH